MLGTQDTVGADPMLGSTWTTVAVAAMPRPAPSEKSFKSVRRGRGLTRRFQRFQCHLQDLQQPAPAATGSTPADSLKSGKPWPARFHRFQRNSHCRFTLSTAGLYDLYTRYGQSVDKKGLQRSVRNYPQVPPQPQGPLYRGFHANKSLLNHKDRLFFHEIWPYHHHHALDLYPDLEAWQGPNPPESTLWTVASAGTADRSLSHTQIVATSTFLEALPRSADSPAQLALDMIAIALEAGLEVSEALRQCRQHFTPRVIEEKRSI